jgi:pyruvate formate lyase activating enzyme
MLTANIIDIKHLAVHDGPGIRTTIFFKGCPLRCQWCHNPESQIAAPQLGLLHKCCIKCRQCAEVCPHHRFIGNEHIIDRSSCTACGKCVNACPVNALELYGKTVTIEKAVEELLTDKVFYQNSNGGCTASGGEPLLQSDFCAELFAELKKHDIHTALDTCGAVPWSAFEKVLPVTDMILFDLKHPDSAQHKAAVGMGNEQLLKNLFELDKYNKPIEIRIPLIPGINSDTDSLQGFAKILTALRNVSGVKVLPFHHARFKYQALGAQEPLNDLEPCSNELAEDVRKYFINNNIKVLTN